MRKIRLRNCREYALVDAEIFDSINKFKWHKHESGYAFTSIWDRQTKRVKTVYMQRFILQTAQGLVTDHKDFNKLNNQKTNLRECSRSQNGTHSRPRKNANTRFKGVYWQPSVNRWLVKIIKDGRYIHVGRFREEIAAAKAYNAAAKKHLGHFCYLNFIP